MEGAVKRSLAMVTTPGAAARIKTQLAAIKSGIAVLRDLIERSGDSGEADVAHPLSPFLPIRPQLKTKSAASARRVSTLPGDGAAGFH
jgi:hypothetical protein